MFEFDDRFDRRMPIFLSRKRGPRIAPAKPDVIEVECIYDQISTGAKVQRWVPLTEVIDLPLGYVVRSGLMDIDGLPLMKLKARGFVARHSVASPKAAYSHFGVLPDGTTMANQGIDYGEVWVDDRQLPPLVIAKGEYTRFVLGPSGRSFPIFSISISTPMPFSRGSANPRAFVSSAAAFP